MPNNEINMDVQGQGSASVSMNPSVDDAAFVGRAEAWAVGKRNGTDVPSTDPAYHNNAKYYATEAAASAEDAHQYTAAAVHTWLENNVDPETGYVLDRTLSEKLAAAPADMVGDLKSALTSAVSDINTLDNRYETTWEQGGYGNNGVPITPASAYRIKTPFIAVPIGIKSLSIDGVNCVVNIISYDTSGNWIGASGWVDGANLTIEGRSGYKITAKYPGDTDIEISPSEGANIKILYNTELLDKIEQLENNTSEIDEIIESISSGNISFDVAKTDLIAGKALNSSGAEITDTNSYVTDYIEAHKGLKIRSIVSRTTYSDSTRWYQYVCFYNSSKTYISNSRIGGEKYTEVNGEAPDGTAYIRVSLTYIGSGYVDSFKFSQYANNGSPQNKWYIFGDSISAGYYSLTEAEASEKGIPIVFRPEGISGVGSAWDTTLSHNYWGYANNWLLHRQLVGKAYPGQGYIRASANNKNGIMEVVDASLSDAGLITVAWGFNDWHYNGTNREVAPSYTRGDHTLIDPSVPYPTENYDTTQITTVNQAIWFCLGELIRKAPQAKIVVQTPMNGWAYGGDFASDWGIGTTKENTGTLADIHDDIKYWADYYGLQVLEMTYGNSVINRRNIQSVLLDGSHPSDPAHQQLGRRVATMLGYCEK